MTDVGSKNTMEPVIETEADVKAQSDIFANPKPKARALANRRLVRVFGIDNVFTSENDAGYRNRFKEESERKMRAAIKMETENDPDDWESLRRSAMVYVYTYLERQGDTVDVAELVQFVTLKISLKYLFPDAEAGWNAPQSFDHIKLIGRRINELWIQSKKPNDATKWADQKDLHRALRAVTASTPPGALTTSTPPTTWSMLPRPLSGFMEYVAWCISALPFYGRNNPDLEQPRNNEIAQQDLPDPLVPRQNPMNWLLPAYETMWRVVMRCLLEVKYRGTQGGPDWERTIQQWIHTPQKNPWKARGEAGVTPLEVIKEALLLYPPVSRIHRETEEGEVFGNIKACHYGPLLGGDNPRVFRPQRWQELEQDKTKPDADKILSEKRKILGSSHLPFLAHQTRRRRKHSG
jgi:hypothetical protein